MRRKDRQEGKDEMKGGKAPQGLEEAKGGYRRCSTRYLVLAMSQREA